MVIERQKTHITADNSEIANIRKYVIATPVYESSEPRDACTVLLPARLPL